MAKRQTDMETELANAMRNWTAVNRAQDPEEWKAWIAFRKQYLGSNLTIDNLTVPTPFPPISQQAINSYLDVINLIRRINGFGPRRPSASIIPFQRP